MIENYINTNSYTMLHICLDQLSNHIIKGRAYCCTQADPILFNDISDLILQADILFDKNGNPMAFEQKRSFLKKQEIGSYQNKPYMYLDYHTLEKFKGLVKTFDIAILSRRKSSWQGILFFDGKEEAFHDVLELIKKLYIK